MRLTRELIKDWWTESDPLYQTCLMAVLILAVALDLISTPFLLLNWILRKIFKAP